MLKLDAASVSSALPYDRLIAALEVAFRNGVTVPPRAHHEVAVPGGTAGNLLLMPSWTPGGRLGIKIATVFPDNRRHGLAAVQASYLLMDATTGVPLAMMDANELTLRRTSAASALAARILSRTDSQTLLMVGTGKLAPHMVRAHRSVRDYRRILIWGRREQAGTELVRRLQCEAQSVEAVEDLESAVRAADVICCATLTTEPLIRGAWLQPGQHIDLVGAFKPSMREADADALARSKVFVDTHDGARREAGDILQAIQEGKFRDAEIVGDLAAMVRRDCETRTSDSEITLFKSVGTALEDLAAAELVLAHFEP